MIGCCFVCEKTRPVEMDHIWPKCDGGTKTVPLCRACHDAKDRQALENWDPIEVTRGVEQLWSSLHVEGRLLWLKMMSVMGRGRHAFREAHAALVADPISADVVPRDFAAARLLYPWSVCTVEEWSARSAAENAAWLLRQIADLR